MYLHGFLWLVLISGLFSCSGAGKNIDAVRGVADLRSFSGEDLSRVRLKGQWEFYWQEFLSASASGKSAQVFIEVPGSWTQMGNSPQEPPSHGYVTYALTVLLPRGSGSKTFYLKTGTIASAARVIVNGKELISLGKPETTESAAIPSPRTGYVPFVPDSDVIRILIHCSNYDHRWGGLWENVSIGLSPADSQWILENLLQGMFLLVLVTHFLLWFHNRDDRASYWMTVLTLIIAIRQGVLGEKVYLTWFNIDHYALVLKTDYLTFFLAYPAGLWFLFSVFPGVKNRLAGQIVSGTGIVFSLITLVSDTNLASRLIPVYQIIYLAQMVYALGILGTALWRRYRHARTILAGILCIAVFSINDILYAQELIKTGYYLHFGMFGLILSFSAAIAADSAQNLSRLTATRKSLVVTSGTMTRFFPAEFLNLLGVSDASDLRPGDHVSAVRIVLTVLCRPAAAEGAEPGEIIRNNPEIISRFMSTMIPFIRNSGGSVVRMYHNGFMAIYPEDTGNVLATGIEIRRKLKEFNTDQKYSGYPPLEAGIVLHRGDVLVGVAGDEVSMNFAIISDVADLSEKLAEKSISLPDSLVFTHALKDQADANVMNYRKVGSARISASEKLPLYAVTLPAE